MPILQILSDADDDETKTTIPNQLTLFN